MTFATAPPSPASRWVLGVGALLTGSGICGAWLATDLTWLRFFETFHWTAATSTAAVLGWMGIRRAPASDRTSARWLAAGLAAYALGQWLWNTQVLLGYSDFPAPADAFYLLLGPCLAVGMVRFIRARTAGTQLTTAWLDIATLSLALLALLLALYLPLQGATPWLQLVVLMAYPMTLWSAVAVALVMVTVQRLRPGWGVLGALLGLSTTAASWMAWNYLALHGQAVDGQWFNPLFSLGALAMGATLGLSHLETSTAPHWERWCEGLLRQLPVVAVAITAMAVMLSDQLPTELAWIRTVVHIGFILVLGLAMLRQGALLKEHDELRQAQSALLRSQKQLDRERELLKTLVKTLPDLVWLKGPDSRYLSSNTRFEQMLGLSVGRIVGKSDHDFFDDQLAKSFDRSDLLAMASEGQVQSELWIAPFGHSTKRLFEITKTRAMDEQGQLIGVLGVARDITEDRLAQQALEIAAVAFETQQAMVVTNTQSVILQVNHAFAQSTGYSAEELVGQTPALLRSGRHDRAFYAQMWQQLIHTGTWQGEVWDRRKNGEVYPKWLTLSAVKNKQGEVTHYVGAHHDITERKKAEERINELAFFDQLTGLPNRTLLHDRIQQALASSARTGEHGALIYIDLDQFKTLNDAHGHNLGDQLLRQVAQRLGACVREHDTVARLGGDEFVVLLGALGLQDTEAATHAEGVAHAILKALDQPYPLGDVVHRCTASMGVTLFNNLAQNGDELMKQADLAMYKAKGAGRNAVRFFDPAMEEAVKARAALEADLRLALDEQQLLLHLQPQVNPAGVLTGAEALVRWQHPQRGMVSPASFIPLAEETGLIGPLGRWVLHTACTHLASWARHPVLGRLTLAVNVSAHQFHQPGFVTEVREVLRHTGANPRRLKLELTESMLVSNMDVLIEKMRELKAWGVGFSLDDFGTGFSSLSYLKRLPLDQLKIDQSFVRDVLDDPNSAAIARTIVALGHSLGLEVVAEGVETVAQRDFLLAMGCHGYQGYLFSRPLPVAALEALAQQAGTSLVPPNAPALQVVAT